MSSENIDFDAISLEQALIDFEVANARVIDLTGRLNSLSKELVEVRGQLAAEKARPPEIPQERYIPEQVEQERRILRELCKSRALQVASLFAPRLRTALKQARTAALK